MSQREPDNPEDKYVICVKKNSNKIIGHLPLGRLGKFAKTIFYFLKADGLSFCKVITTGKHANLEDGYDISDVKCLDILQKQIE